MPTHRIATILVVGLLVSIALVPGAAAAQPDDCMNADKGPDESGPPGFVAGLVPDFLSGLIGSLPVPNFVKSFFGAPTC